MQNEQLKFKVLSLLLHGKKPKEIEAEVEGAVYATILRWRRELEEAQENDTLDELINLDKALLGEVLTEVASNVPEALAEAADEVITNISKAVTVAEKLQTDLMMTAAGLNTRIKALAHSVDNVNELVMLSEVLCNLQNAFFNKNSTQVNVQNNFVDPNNAYSGFLEDKPNGQLVNN